MNVIDPAALWLRFLTITPCVFCGESLGPIFRGALSFPIAWICACRRVEAVGMFN